MLAYRLISGYPAGATLMNLRANINGRNMYNPRYLTNYEDEREYPRVNNKGQCTKRRFKITTS
jgi:hypothetical protein